MLLDYEIQSCTITRHSNFPRCDVTRTVQLMSIISNNFSFCFFYVQLVFIFLYRILFLRLVPDAQKLAWISFSNLFFFAESVLISKKLYIYFLNQREMKGTERKVLFLFICFLFLYFSLSFFKVSCLSKELFICEMFMVKMDVFPSLSEARSLFQVIFHLLSD